MPPQAYALVSLFLVCSVMVGIVAVRLAVLLGGPVGWRAHLLPVAAGFLAFYLIGHRFGISIGPEISLFGFQVALLGDVLIGFTAALLVAVAQAVVVRSARGRAAGQPS